MEKGQAERLMPLLEEVLAEGGAAWRDLTAIGVGTGPGNFTGIRISVAAARGLALGLGIPAHGVSAFEALADGLPRPVLVVQDARRGQVYVQEFRNDGPQAAHLTELVDLDRGLVPMPRVGSAASAGPGGSILQPAYPVAVAIARVAAGRSATGQPRPAPMYLRSADAALPSDPPPVILP